jgi:hypothetical protein
MRRFLKLSIVCIAAGVVGACSPDTVVETQAIPTAGIRFINAVPDTGAMDFRFVDIVENSAHWGIGYRNNPATVAGETVSLLVQFKNARAGQRQFRIFMNGISPAVASTIVKDTTVTLVEGRNYTVLMLGYANPSGPNRPAGAPPMEMRVIDETVTVPAGQVALRVINASTSTVDVFHRPASSAPPGTPIATGLGPMSISGYVNAAPGQIRYLVQGAGDPSVAWADQLALMGSGPQVGGSPCDPATQTCDLEGTPGTTQAGSAVTAIIFPLSVTGTAAPALPITTGATPQRATATGYAAPRDYAADGFFVGQEITASGFTNPANNGPSVVTAVIPRRTTGSATLAATATGYSRTTGSFITNGFAVGDEITASGFTTAANNGRSIVTAVTATDLTVTKAVPTVAEAAAAGRTLISDGRLDVNKVGGTVVEPFPTSNRTIVGVRGRLLSFMFDSRPPRPAGT